MFKLLKESWLSLTLVLVILATVCTVTFAWREDFEKVSMTANSALVNVKLSPANDVTSDPEVLNLTALQEGQTAYVPFQMENRSNVPTNVYFKVCVKDADGEEMPDALRDWTVSILNDKGEPLEISEDETAFVEEVAAAEKDAEMGAYTLQLNAADADIPGFDEDTQLYVTADVRIAEAEVSSSQESSDSAE